MDTTAPRRRDAQPASFLELLNPSAKDNRWEARTGFSDLSGSPYRTITECTVSRPRLPRRCDRATSALLHRRTPPCSFCHTCCSTIRGEVLRWGSMEVNRRPKLIVFPRGCMWMLNRCTYIGSRCFPAFGTRVRLWARLVGSRV